MARIGKEYSLGFISLLCILNGFFLLYLSLYSGILCKPADSKFNKKHQGKPDIVISRILIAHHPYRRNSIDDYLSKKYQSKNSPVEKIEEEIGNRCRGEYQKDTGPIGSSGVQKDPECDPVYYAHGGNSNMRKHFDFLLPEPLHSHYHN